MRITWHGQSAFLIDGQRPVFIDPFGEMEGLAARGMTFDYPPIDGVEAELLLVTHEHADHNGVEAIGGSPHILRSTAGTFETPLGEIVAIASEHDDAAGTLRACARLVREPAFARGGRGQVARLCQGQDDARPHRRGTSRRYRC